MSVPTLFAAEPLTIAATFDKVWVSEISVSAENPAADAIARVKLRRFRTVDGAVEFAPEPAIWLEVESLLATSASDPQLASVVAGLMGYVARIGIEQGVIASPGA
jgi:hypothetical protein